MPGLAQQAPAPAAAASAPTSKGPTQLEAVTITGIRGALEQSLNVKRNADSHIDVISAEDIGKMPDKNVADSLARVPGVTISSASANEGGFDENDRVSMRGTNPSLTQTLINGHVVSSGDWFVLNQTGLVGRSVSYSLLPSELVSRVEVHKSSQAYLPEGGVAGYVDIITRKPLDFRKSLTLEASLGVVHATLPKKTDPQLNALGAWKNEANTAGVMLQVFSEKRHLRRDGQEILGYNRIAPDSPIVVGTGGAPGTVTGPHPDLANVWYPTLIGSALFEQERKREGGLLDIQIKPTDRLTLDLSLFSSKMEAGNYNRNFMLWPGSFIGGANQAPDPGYVVRNETLVSASFANAGGGRNYGVYDQISRPDESSDSNFINFDGKLRVSDALTVSTKIGTSKGNGNTPTQDVAEWNVPDTGASYVLNGINSAANWSLPAGNPASPAGMPLGWIFGDQNIKVKDKDSWAQIDADYALDAGPLTLLKFGARMQDHTRKSENVIGQGPLAAAFDPANWPQGFLNYPGNFGSGLGGAFPRNVWYYTPEQLAAFNANFTNRDPVSRRNWNSEYALDEKNSAAYVQGNLEGKGWSGNVGLRLVKTRERVTNNVAVDATTPGAITTSAFGPFLPVTTEHTYNDVLPSANLKLELRKDLVARFAVSKTMTRPDYSALAAPISLTPPPVGVAEGTGTGGNPDLKPVRSTNFDANVEWYFAPRALVSAGVFYMNLTSYIGFGQVTRNFMTFSQQNPQGVSIPYVLTVPVNSKGKVKGIELAAETPVLGNFGVGANYTYADGEESGGGPLVGTSKHTYNLSAYYEDDRFNARIAYNFRSKFYSGLDRNTAFSQDDIDSVSASLGYKITDNFSVTFDAHNLNNPKLKYFALNEDQPRSIYQNGRQYYLTARVKF
ncbi:TonB-dependent receptor [Piscinibacter sp. XHJ-5]|uniref:TonB-dependent receptor n=1 Tax=Piscinibacter sp. XHJ-5 TaxID=3037797 RepID=UPI00245297D5|nr:TonB-dependent receptor [Piscinibacter sp. XHJ-5]